MSQFQSYVICTSPRSGSTLLCRLLSEVENAGLPDSHFHEPALDEWLREYGFGVDEYDTRKEALRAVFRAAHEYGKGKSDVFGLRLQRHSFDFFIDQLRVLYPALLDDKSRFEAAFGRTLFIHLTRENKLDQAISYVKAQQSGLWHLAPDGTEIERLSEPQQPFYDPTAIKAQLRLSEQMDSEWQSWFVSEGIIPLRITYDELSAKPHETLGMLLKKLGLEDEGRTETALPTAKLADATSREWAERFRSEEYS